MYLMQCSIVSYDILCVFSDTIHIVPYTISDISILWYHLCDMHDIVDLDAISDWPTPILILYTKVSSNC